MIRQSSPLRGPAVAAVAIAVLVLLALGQKPAYTDDIDLLRFTTAKPYVFFILDNSASMTLSPSGEWVHGNGDDPRSKLYQAKKVIYDVFKDVNDIHFGYAAYNQDYARVTAKHWLYYFTATASNKLPTGWPINYPASDADGPIATAADGTVSSDIDGDLMTFGSHLDATGILGTCNAPLPLGNVGTDDREIINRYAKLGVSGNGPTRMWIQGGSGNKTYRLTVERPLKKPDATTDNPNLGKDNMDVRLTLEEVKNSGCTGDQTATFQTTSTATIELTLWTDFLMYDEDNGRTPPTGSKAGGIDYAGGLLDAKDIQDVATCGSGHPFSGKGWEGNYDTVPVSAGAAIDPYCKSASDSATCSNLKRITVPDPDYGRPLDKGDMIPFDWRTEQKTEFIQRFAPNYGAGTPDFRIASYFKDSPEATTGSLALADASRIPIFGSGPSPLGKSVIDFRCWYLGEGNKCNEDAYGAGGWESVAASKDSEWGCRRPYLIVLSDGGDSCAGENPCADTADLKQKAGARTWVIAYGADCTKAGNPLKCMAQNGGGELLCPKTATDLKTELEKILGLIRQEARSFASAAVPSVQAIVEDKIFLTNFTPLNGKAIWDGHVHSFIKPLPLRSTDSKPDTSHPNHVWDAGKVMVDTQVNTSDPVGSGANQRRVYYTREHTTSEVPYTRQYFETAPTDPDDLRFDFWRGLGLSFVEDDLTSETAAHTAASTVVANTFAVKTAIVDVKNADGTTTPTTVRYVLGDIFHSNPLVVGSPPNTQYYALDLNDYQEFAEKHRLRRKMLLVGANDGMMHAFDAGKYSNSSDKFDNGTGKEVFGFIPRTVMPTVRLISDPSVTTHQWSVDGTITVSDAFIDPKHTGTPTDSEREWRTLAIGGLREGGAGYYAVDITQPDKLSPGDDPGEDFVPQPDNGYIPSCNGESGFSEASCGPVPFPSVLWEFDDSVVSLSGNRVKLDEEDTGFPLGDGNPNGNGRPDLGEAWSIPNVGRIRVAESTGSEDTRDMYVAVFGGGLDPANKTNPQIGSWIYIVDIETGKAIYKRQLEGGMPSEPAAVDSNGDGYLDRIYAGTTGGFIYRIDMTGDIVTGPDPDDRLYPALEPQLVRRVDGVPHIVQRIPMTSWAPKKIFDANWELTTATLVPRPVFFRPSVVFDSKLGTYLLAFGTGDRDDLWNNDGQTGRFYLFADDSDKMTAAELPMKETNFTRVLVASTALGGTLESKGVGQRGWYLVLDPNERVINDAFALAGVTFFSTFKPRVEVATSKEGPQCSKTGVSRIFIVSTLNADPFVQPPSGVTEPPSRAFEVANFVTNPFAEQGQTKNESTGVAEICDDETKLAIMESMKSLFPPTCKFSNYRVDIKTIASDTSLVCIAPVPVCVIQKNWKEY